MIDRFRGEHFYLSNMYPLSVWIPSVEGVLVPTSEHDYMASRFQDAKIGLQVANARGDESDRRVYKDGLAAKNLAHKFVNEGELQLDDWEVARLGIMYAAVKKKFEYNKDIARLLYDTDDEELVEGNTWEDRFWGVDPPGSTNGSNNLGKILMQIRNELTI